MASELFVTFVMQTQVDAFAIDKSCLVMKSHLTGMGEEDTCTN